MIPPEHNIAVQYKSHSHPIRYIFQVMQNIVYWTAYIGGLKSIVKKKKRKHLVALVSQL